MQCPWCNKDLHNENAIVRHASRVHKKKRFDYDLLVKHNNIRPLCLCGCGEQTEYSQHFLGFNRYVHSHQAQHEPIRSIMIEKGRAIANDPEKIKRIGDSSRARWSDPEWKSKQMKIRSDPNSEWSKKKNAATVWVYTNKDWLLNQSQKKKAYWDNEERSAKFRQYMKSEGFSTNVSAGTKKALADPDIRRKLSEHACRLIEEGIIGPNKTNRFWMTNELTGEEMYLHSTWEGIFVQSLTDEEKAVTRKHGIRIEYLDADGNTRRYVPDFVSFDDKIIYEVKGQTTSNDELKSVAARAWCSDNGFDYVLINKNDIDAC